MVVLSLSEAEAFPCMGNKNAWMSARKASELQWRSELGS